MIRRKRLARVYRAAAERLLKRDNMYCCTAIEEASDGLGGGYDFWIAARDLFRAFFEPPPPVWSIWWPVSEVEPRVQALLLLAEMVEGGCEVEPRVQALLLMAEMVEGGCEV